MTENNPIYRFLKIKGYRVSIFKVEDSLQVSISDDKNTSIRHQSVDSLLSSTDWVEIKKEIQKDVKIHFRELLPSYDIKVIPKPQDNANQMYFLIVR